MATLLTVSTVGSAALLKTNWSSLLSKVLAEGGWHKNCHGCSQLISQGGSRQTKIHAKLTVKIGQAWKKSGCRHWVDYRWYMR